MLVVRHALVAVVLATPLAAAAQPAPEPAPTEAQPATEAAPPAPPPAAPASPTPAPAPPPGAAPAEPAPYSAQPGGRPPPPPVSAGVVRRAVELVPNAGLAFPSCAAGTDSDDRCEGVAGGASFGFSAFWRVSPYFAWGGGFDIAAFRYEAPEAAGLKDTQAGAAWIGLLGRVYVMNEGSLDPYFQLGLGGAALGTTGTLTSGPNVDQTYEETGAGPALQLGAGIDFILGSRIKLGPAFSYTRVFVDKIRRCRAGSGGDCEDVSKDDAGHLNAFLTLGARLTIMVGDEL